MAADPMHRKFEALFHREADGLFRFCLLRTGKREEARDMAQEAFARLWKVLREGKEIAEERAYLYTTARHLLIDWYRKKHTESLEALFEDEEGERFEIPDEAASRQAGLSAEVREVVEAINHLDPVYRTPVYLRLVEEMLPHEIAAALGVNANVISIRITRGLKQLREALGIDEELT